MLSSERISGSSALDLICSDAAVASHMERKQRVIEPADDDSYSQELLSARVSSPSKSAVAEFESRDPMFSSSAALVRSSSAVTGRYDLNWCSPSDYRDNWEKLSSEDKLTYRKLILSDTYGNANRYGVKKLNLESHLLLSVGCDMTNIVGNGRNAVLTNLKDPVSKLYASKCLHERATDPKTCLRASKEFIKSHNLELLYKQGFVAYQAVVSVDLPVQVGPSDELAKKSAFQSFFKGNCEAFRKLQKKKKIYSYVYSHEISVDSILQGVYRPHTHILFFLPKESKPVILDKVRLFEAEFNSMFSDRTMSVDQIDSDGEFVPKAVSKAANAERTVGYFYRAYSLANQYMREIRSDNVRTLNTATVECYRRLVWFLQAEEANGLKGVRRTGCSNIPSAEDGEDYVHPLLQKGKKSNTIKKEKSKKEKIQEDYDLTQYKPSDAAVYGSDQPGTARELQKDSERTGIRPGFFGWCAEGIGRHSGKDCDRPAVEREELPEAFAEGTFKDEHGAWRQLSIFFRRARSHHIEPGDIPESSRARGQGSMGRDARGAAEARCG